MLMKSILNRLRAFGNSIWGEPNREIALSRIQIEHNGGLYKASAVYDGVRIKREPDGIEVLFSVEKGGERIDLTLEVFDGFEWDLTALVQPIGAYDREKNEV